MIAPFGGIQYNKLHVRMCIKLGHPQQGVRLKPQCDDCTPGYFFIPD
jgi:hypothetical protein